jgi:hypothetical protein
MSGGVLRGQDQDGAFCVVSNEYDGEFNPTDLRTGGGQDLAIDAAALAANLP